MDSEGSVKVSVLMTVYNAERYLAMAIDSILGQTFSDFEFLIIDDGSSDGSGRILREYRERDDRIRVFSRENRGLIYSLNEGISYCRTPLLARMDADDISCDTRLEKQVAWLEAHPEYVAVGSFSDLIDEDGDAICPGFQLETHEEIDESHMQGHGGRVIQGAALFRVSALRKLGGFRFEYIHAEDYDLFLRLAEIGRIANIPERLYRYRMHDSSVGHKYGELQRESSIAALKDACARRGLPFTSPFPARQSDEIENNRQRWAWWSLLAGNVGTARKHAWNFFLKRPLSLTALRLLFCCYRGY